MIYITNLSDMPGHVDELGPVRIITLLAPDDKRPSHPSVPRARHHHVTIHDINRPLYDHVLAGPEHVAPLIEFIQDWQPDEGALLIHCFAGISRSTAAALIALVVKSGGQEVEAAKHLRSLAPHAKPNLRMVEVADQLLDCDGRLIAAEQAMEPAELAFSGPLVRLPLL